MPTPPSGLLTFLFTDVEGSTRLWETHPEAMAAAIARHDALLRAVIEERNGYVFKTIGDAFCAAFARPRDALDAALAMQRGLAAQSWGEVGAIRVRAALHSGLSQERDADYFGPTVNRVARLLAVGHGGQVLLSQAAVDELGDALDGDATLRDLGDRRLKDLTEPERIYQLVAEGLEETFPPLKSLDARPNNLPLQPTPLLGRDAELTTIKARLRQRGHRVLTLTGPGGTGKTRLALQAAADLLDDFAHGVWFIDLSPVTDPALVAAEIARALEVREEGDQPLDALLRDHLKERELLLVLDNFEQVLPAAKLVSALVAASPALRVLITSRRPARIAAEQELPIEPLPVPDPKRLPDLAHLAAYPAIELFVERARAVQPSFALIAANAATVAGICAKLDGLPLAIELAAARVRLLPPAALLSRLESRLKVLTGGARDRPERQQTLRAAIAWSYDLLTEDEQALFARIAVFADGSTFEAIEAICNPNGEVDVFEGIASLVEHNLIRQEAAADGEPRFRMLATIREFAQEQLAERQDLDVVAFASGLPLPGGGGAIEGSEGDSVRRAHAAYYQNYAEEALAEPDEAVWLDRVEMEHGNLRAALAWLLETTGAEERALRLAGALSGFWYVRGYLTEGRSWLERALAVGHDAPPEVRAKALDGAGALADVQGDTERSDALIAEALELYRSVDDQRGVAIALDGLGLLATKRGDYDRAASLHEEALAIHRASGERRGMATSINNLGSIACLQDDPTRGTALFEEALALCRGLGDRWIMAVSLGNLGMSTRDQGDHERSFGLYREALAAWQELEDMVGVADCLAGIGRIAGERGQPERAARLFSAAEALCRTDGGAFAPIDQAQYDRAVAATRARLGDAAFASAWEAGAAFSLDDAIADALDTDASRGDQ
ncbi:MAG: tetratricopeptide repeat protein [Thermomicrobiales bacterium]|nr:tetratricopeptide repeat protein [Thermomicrobiales bacterium]